MPFVDASTAPDTLNSPREMPSEDIPRILVVDDDPRFLVTMRSWLGRRNMQVVCAETSKGALVVSQTSRVDVAVIDYRLRGGDNGLVLAQTLHALGIPFIMVSQYFSTALTVQAVKLGADNCLDKPTTADLILKAVDLALARLRIDAPRTYGSQASLHPPLWDEIPSEEAAPRKLAVVLLRACGALKDPKTNQRLARAGGVSTRRFREMCDQCGVKPRDARDFVRILRAVRLSWVDGSMLASHFNPGDRRTALGLLARAGLSPGCCQIDLRTLFQTQQLVPRHLEILSELAHLAANSPLFQDTSWEVPSP